MSYGQQQGGDDFMRWIAVLTAFRQAVGGGPESQIHTQEPISVKTRLLLPLGQAGAVVLCLCAFVAGLFLFSSGVDWLLDLGWDPGGYLLIWSVLLVVVGVVVGVVRQKLAAQVRAVQSFAVVLALLMLGLAVGSALMTVHENFDVLRMAPMVLGMALVFGSMVLSYNQALDLVQPYWRRSPFEDAIAKEVFPLLRGMMTQQPQAGPSVREQDPRFPKVNQNGTGEPAYVHKPLEHRPGIGYVEELAEEDEDEPEEWEEVTIAPEAGNLVWFALFAVGQRSLTISGLTVRPAPLLPFRERDERGHERELRLRRAMIRRLLARGSTERIQMVDGIPERGLGDKGWWHLRGQGATPEWARLEGESEAECRARVRREATTMWREVMGDVPVPDYWTETQYVLRKEAA